MEENNRELDVNSIETSLSNSSKRQKLSHIENESSVKKIDDCLIEKNIISLPVEIILKIFSYLPKSNLNNLKQVNKLFQQIAYDPKLWMVYKVN